MGSEMCIRDSAHAARAGALRRAASAADSSRRARTIALWRQAAAVRRAELVHAAALVNSWLRRDASAALERALLLWRAALGAPREGGVRDTTVAIATAHVRPSVIEAAATRRAAAAGARELDARRWEAEAEAARADADAARRALAVERRHAAADVLSLIHI